MRRVAFLVSILFFSLLLPLGNITPSQAQGVSPNPGIELQCEDQIEFGILVHNNSSLPAEVICRLHNPTQYLETVAVEFFNSTREIEVPAYSNVSISNLSFKPEFSKTIRDYPIFAKVIEANGVQCPSCTNHSVLLHLYPKWAGEYVRFEFQHEGHVGTFDVELIPYHAPNTVASILGHVDSNYYVGKNFDGLTAGPDHDGLMIAGVGWADLVDNGSMGHSGEWFGYCHGQFSTSSDCDGDGQLAWWAPRDNSTLPWYEYTITTYWGTEMFPNHYGFTGSQFTISINNLSGVPAFDPPTPQMNAFGYVIEGTEEVDYLSNLNYGIFWDAGVSYPVITSTERFLPDFSPPVASVTVEEHPFYPDSLSDHGNKTVGAVDWPIHLVKLSSSNDVKVHFDACASRDPDAPLGVDGITLYKWKVLFDYPWNAVSDLNHEFERTSAMGCDWSYTFWNQTADPSGFNENTIRIELIVVDRVGRESAKNYMFFVVVPEGWSDEPPVVEISSPVDGSTQSGDYVYVNGSVLSGSENGDVHVEVALNPDVLNQTLVDKYQQMNQGKYNSTNNLCDASTATVDCGRFFSMSLKLEDLYDGNHSPQTIWVKIVEGNGQNWVLWKRIDIFLDPDVEPADDPDNSTSNSTSEPIPDDPPLSIDSDGDGFDDNTTGEDADDCPSEWGTSTEYGRFGCPDTDGDGWADVDDDCKTIPGNSSVEPQKGCTDSDGDGWANSMDAFPADHREWMDSDSDGVGDGRDLCPNTPTEVPVDDDGCADDDSYSDILVIGAIGAGGAAIGTGLLFLGLPRMFGRVAKAEEMTGGRMEDELWRDPPVSEEIGIDDSDSIWTDDDSS